MCHSGLEGGGKRTHGPEEERRDPVASLGGVPGPGAGGTGVQPVLSAVQELAEAPGHPHPPGQELYVDYAGPKIRIDPPGRKPQWVCLFVAVMGRSSYTFAYATRNMRSASWILAHRKTFEYLGGVPAVVIPDRTTTAVLSGERVEPRLHPAFQALALHYGFEVAPARARKARDKGAVKKGVLDAQRRLVAPLPTGSSRRSRR